jgi:membrane protein implicated in regulation of membrane protease activity
MIKAFFKGCWEVLSIFLALIGIIALGCGFVHLVTITNPLVGLIILFFGGIIAWGSYRAYEEYQQMQDPKYDYQKEKKLIQEMWKTNWLTDEEYKVMISKLITKYHNKGVK